MTSQPVRCGFYLRTPAGKGTYHYDPIEVANPSGHMSIETSWPPAVGDLINLLDKNREIPGGPVFRVVDRCWDHEHWKSEQWPEGEREPLVGPILEVIVEPASGPFHDEVPDESDGRET